MNWFQLIGNAIMAGVTLGDRLYVRIRRCSCGKPGARLDKNDWDRWYVYCSSPTGCKRRAADARTRRRAKQNWNEEIRYE